MPVITVLKEHLDTTAPVAALVLVKKDGAVMLYVPVYTPEAFEGAGTRGTFTGSGGLIITLAPFEAVPLPDSDPAETMAVRLYPPPETLNVLPL